MSSSQVSTERQPAGVPAAVDLKLEVVTIPVSDVDRAKRFYEGIGWRLDFSGYGWRAVQLTPPGSPCSIHLGTTAAPGSAQGLFLVVDDIDAARADLIRKGVEVSEPFHFAGIRGPVLPGPDPERGSYRSYASFSDPDGTSWLLQEIKTRLPGRGFSTLDVVARTNQPHPSTTGPGGTPLTSSRVSVGRVPTRRPKMLRVTSRVASPYRLKFRHAALFAARAVLSCSPLQELHPKVSLATPKIAISIAVVYPARRVMSISEGTTTPAAIANRRGREEATISHASQTVKSSPLVARNVR